MLNQSIFTGAVLMDLSKGFVCIPHNSSIARLHAYGLSFDTVTFLNLYLKDRKQNARINNTFRASPNILSGVAQGFILGLILFNLFLNDLSLRIKKPELHSENTITVTCNTLTELLKTLVLKTLEQEFGSAVT